VLGVIRVSTTGPYMDDTIVLIAPTGPIYRTEPHGASMFRALAGPTDELHIPQD
jgi:hypothetical protein